MKTCCSPNPRPIPELLTILTMKRSLLLFMMMFAAATRLTAQPVCMPWGNIKGMIIDGEMMAFETSLRSVSPGWEAYVKTEKYHWEGQQTYTVEGESHLVSHYLLGTPLHYRCRMTGTGAGKASTEIDIRAEEAYKQAGTFYCFETPESEFSDGSLIFLLKNKQVATLSLNEAVKNEKGELIRLRADRVEWKSPRRNYRITAGKATEVFLRQDFDSNPAYRNDPWPQQQFATSDPRMEKAGYQLYFTLIDGNAGKGESRNMAFSLEANGTIDREPATVRITPSQPGRVWSGISGNFRFQFPETDPMVIDYCLDSLRVTMGRISMWWEMWHADEHSDPAEMARAGKLPLRFYEQMELARKLQQRSIPVIVSVWSAPDWAVDKNNIPRKGVHLDQQKMKSICASISGFLLYLKQEYGVEAVLFSFNETDCGVEVFQTPEEHALFNRAIGAELQAKGLATKMLLGDTGHGTAVANQLVWPSISDPSVHNTIGAIAFHTYHGCNTVDLEAWARSARAINVPLMVTEGGTNSAAHRYPLVFLQPWFQLGEIDTYIRICNICQPATIMEWQLTSDYSVLTGKGLYGDNGPLRPTQRFYNLKQLGNTPEGSFWIPASCDRPEISCAAAVDIANDTYSVHMVNNGPRREVVLNGFPESVENLYIYITDANRGMKRMNNIRVVDGTARFTIEPQTFTSLFNKPAETNHIR